MKAAIAVLAITVVAAGAATPGYEPWRDTISLLASNGQPHAVAVRAALVLVAVAVLASARRQPTATTTTLFVVAGVAGIVTALAPKDLPGHPGPSTVASQAHVAAAVLGGAALVAAMAIRRAVVAAVATVALAFAFQRTWGTAVYGAVERALVAVPLAWCTTLK